MSKILTVFGATGNQGGSVIKSVLADPVLSKEFRIRAVTRNADKPSAKALQAKGVEVVTADMSSPAGVAPAVEGAHTVFLVTNYWESLSADIEFHQGKAVTDACKAAGVEHLIFSSLINVTKATDGKFTHVSHFDGKAKIEEYIRKSGVPATFVLPGFFMSNFLGMIKKTEDDMEFIFSLPVSGDKAQIPIFDVADDAGKFVKAAIKNFPAQAGQHIYAATEYITPNRLMEEFATIVHLPSRFVQVTPHAYRETFAEPTADEMTENMLLLEKPGYYDGADLAPSLALLDEKPTSWREFVEAHKERWLGE